MWTGQWGCFRSVQVWGRGIWWCTGIASGGKFPKLSHKKKDKKVLWIQSITLYTCLAGYFCFHDINSAFFLNFCQTKKRGDKKTFPSLGSYIPGCIVGYCRLVLYITVRLCYLKPRLNQRNI